MTNEDAKGVVHTCSICTLPMRHPYLVDDYIGNNAYPLDNGLGSGMEGRCCDVCDCMYVLPARMGEMSSSIFGIELMSRYAKVILAFEDNYRWENEGISPDDDGWNDRYTDVLSRLNTKCLPMYVVMMNRYALTGSLDLPEGLGRDSGVHIGGDE